MDGEVEEGGEGVEGRTEKEVESRKQGRVPLAASPVKIILKETRRPVCYDTSK